MLKFEGKTIERRDSKLQFQRFDAVQHFHLKNILVSLAWSQLYWLTYWSIQECNIDMVSHSNCVLKRRLSISRMVRVKVWILYHGSIATIWIRAQLESKWYSMCVQSVILQYFKWSLVTYLSISSGFNQISTLIRYNLMRFEWHL